MPRFYSKERRRRRSSRRKLFAAILFAVLSILVASILYSTKYKFANDSSEQLPPKNERIESIDNQNVTPKESVMAQTIVASEAPAVFFHGSRNSNRIALTFDADMTEEMKAKYLSGKVKSWYNHAVIDILRKTNTKATLFLTGMWIELYPEETRKLAADPLFELGNHSYSHASFFGKCYGLKMMPDSEDEIEMKKTQQLLEQYAGIKNTLFRFPGGCYEVSDLEKANSLGLTVIQWDVVGGDGFYKNPKLIVKQVLRSVQNGSIIILHMHGGPYAPHTAEALPEIISTLKARGYEFVTVSELLDTR